MSVEYRSGVAVGFKLTSEEVSRFPAEIAEDLTDYGFLIHLNGWCASDSILAFYDNRGPEEGCCALMDEIHWEPDDYQEICGTFRRYFPERANEEPHTYIYTQVY